MNDQANRSSVEDPIKFIQQGGDEYINPSYNITSTLHDAQY